jgi:N-acetylneuraminic acid mutarotase
VTTDPDPEFVRSTYASLRPRARAARVRDTSRIGRLARDLHLVMAGARWPSTARPVRKVGLTPILRPTLLKSVAAATFIGVIAVGAAFFVTRPDQPAVGGPSPTPNATVAPSSPASPSAGPSADVIAPRAAAWTATGKMITPFFGTMAGLLPDGRVLVVGVGKSGDGSFSAELYDPGTGTWTSTGKMVGGAGDTATLLRDGKVLVAGSDGAQLYDPDTGTSSATGKMVTPRSRGTATLLADGKVLVAGGASSTVFGLASAEVYDPVSGTWTATGAMDTAREFPTATLLRDGKVLVVGGSDSASTQASAELYDPISGTWTATGRMVVALSDGYSATLLADGKVLVAGGQESGSHQASASAELYDPQSGVWSAIQGMLARRTGHTATLLRDGRVLVTGDRGEDLSAGGLEERLRSAELYDPASGTWSATASMLAKGGHTATLLPDGKVLVEGGTDGDAELYDPGSAN